MTKKEFTEAIRAMRQGCELTEREAPVFAAALFVMRRRLRPPEDQSWKGPSFPELFDFLDGLNDAQRGILKEIAESLIDEVTPKDTIH